MRNGASELEARRKVPHASKGRDTGYMRLVDRIANMKACSKSRFIYAILPCISSRYLPTGRQDCSTSICQQSSVKTALWYDGQLRRDSKKRGLTVTNIDGTTWKSSIKLQATESQKSHDRD
jgi:hypothetical protein